ncbi:MAG: hypothetical protein H6706_11020 [Myxococcales bacterium]|nr:hypothetical protein [Myxococcales bacterium]
MKSWYLLSPRAPHELEALVEGCNGAIEAFREQRPEDACGQVALGGDVPTSAQIVATYRALDLPVTDRLLARLQACSQAIVIRDPADPQQSPLQASALRFLLDQFGGGLVLLDAFPLRTAEEVAAGVLRGTRSLRGFGALADASARLTPEDDDDDDLDPRVEAFLSAAEAAEDDPDVALDLRDRMRDPFTREVARAILDGARSVEALVRVLDADEDDVEDALDDLGLDDEDDDD